MRLFGCLALLALMSATAEGNGRPPVTNGLVLQPGAPDSIYVRSTFGLLVSRDQGCTFKWICEQNIGYGGTFDPKYRVTTDGTIFATTFSGLRVSRDGGCSFNTATAELPAGDPNRIADIWIDALDVGPTGAVWVATAETGKANDVYRSTDNAVTFTPRGLSSPTIWWKSLRVAPSDSRRIYVTGYEVGATPKAHLRRSEDDGENWIPSNLSTMTFNATPIVMVVAVDRQNPQVLFVSSIGSNPPDGDRLYRSTDGGVTFAEVLATTQPIADVVIRDAMTTYVVAGKGGAFRSTDGGATFQPLLGAPELACLDVTPTGELVGCAANWDPDFKAVARSVDGTTWEKVWRFVELDGPLECPAGTPGRDVCGDQMWPALKQQFGATGSTCAEPLTPDAAAPKSGSGCCQTGGSVAPFWAVLVGLWLSRRRRSASRRPTSG